MQKHFNWQCAFGTAVVIGNCSKSLWMIICIWSSIMQKWKNILGSRKKGAQEPHAAREPRNDYQGYTTSNLKGISVERLTLPAGITRYYMFPLFFLLFPSYHWGFLSDHVEHVFLFCFLSPSRKLCPDAGWVPKSGGCGHWYGLSDKSVATPTNWWAGRLSCICLSQVQKEG